MTELNDAQLEILSENGFMQANKTTSEFFKYFRSDSNFDLFNSNYDDCRMLLNYLSNKGLEDYLYVTSGFYAFVLFDIDSLTLIQVAYVKNDFVLIDSYISQFKNRMKQPMSLGKMLSVTDKAYKIMILNFLFADNKLDSKGKRILALETYEHSEYNFEDFNFKKLFLETKDNADDLNKLRSKVTMGNIKIWRGMSNKSLNIENALSWTLNKDIAIRFTRRFKTNDKNGILYSA